MQNCYIQKNPVDSATTLAVQAVTEDDDKLSRQCNAGRSQGVTAKERRV